MPGHSGRTYYSDDDEGNLADLPSAGGHGQRSPLSLFLPTLYLTQAFAQGQAPNRGSSGSWTKWKLGLSSS